MSSEKAEILRLFLCGDVMTGRGIDQALPHPGDPTLHERSVRDAREYLELARRVHGDFPLPLSFEAIWGDALEELSAVRPDLRIINLETSITQSDDYWRDKGIHYRMHPKNVGCLQAVGIDACSLVNNHTADWGCRGLEETLQTLERARVAYAGAGRNRSEAEDPAVLEVPGKGRVLLFSCGSISSGIPKAWSATGHHMGLNVLEDLSKETAGQVAAQMRQFKRPGDIAIASIHWGGNWGYEIPDQQIAFAHRLVDEGFDLIHGHSSHHAKAIEVYHEHLVLYGCGDFITDYEGIRGYEEFRGDLSLMYLPRIDLREGRLLELRLVPLQMRRFRLQRATVNDAQWLCDLLNQVGKPFGTRVERNEANSLYVIQR